MLRKPPLLEEGARTAALVWRLARDFMRPHLPRVALAFVLMGAAAGSTALRAWLMQPVLDRVFVGRDGSWLLLIAGAALAIALVKGISDYGEAVLMNRVGQRVIADVQIALFTRLMRADLAYFHAHPSGTLISRFTSDAVLLRNAAANVLGAIGKDALTVICLVGVMFYQDWVLALVSFFVFPVAIHPIVGIGRRMRRVTANTQAEIGQLTTLLSQTFQGARLVKAYGMEEYEERRAAAAVRARLCADRPGDAHPLARLADDGDPGRRGDRCRHPLRRTPGHRRRAHAGRVLFVRDRTAARLPAAQEPRQSERFAAGRAGGGAPHFSGARCRADDPRPARRPAAAGGGRRDPL